MAIAKYTNFMGTLLLSILSLVSIECTISGEFSTIVDENTSHDTFNSVHRINKRNVPPKWPTTHVTCITAEECSLTCPVSIPEGESSVTVSWTCTSWECPSPKNRSEDGSTIWLNDFIETGEKTYICTYRKSRDLSFVYRHILRLYIYSDEKEIPIIIRKPQNEYESVGSDAYFECAIFNASTSNVTWLLDGKIIENNDHFNISDEGLHITNVTDDLFGNYTCSVNSTRGTASDGAYLFSKELYTEYDDDPETDENHNITKPIEPYFINATKPKSSVIFKSLGDSVVLDCPAGGDPKPDIIWQKDGKPLDPKFGMVGYKNWSMQMKECIAPDSGNYTCIVCNEFGCVNSTYKVTIVGEAPFIKRAHVENGFREYVTAAVEDNATLLCSSKSELNYNITWMKLNCSEIQWNYDAFLKGSLGRVLPGDEKYTIVNVAMSDEGWYSCVLSNRFGKTCQNVYLKVDDGTKTKLIVWTLIIVLTLIVGAVIVTVVILSRNTKKKEKRKRQMMEASNMLLTHGARIEE